MIRDTSNLIQEIAAASQEQMAAIREINVGVSQLDEVVQQNAAASHELASTSSDLAAQSSTLQHQVEFFRRATTLARPSRRRTAARSRPRLPRAPDAVRPGESPARSHRPSPRSAAGRTGPPTDHPADRPLRPGGIVVNLDDDDNFERF